MLGTLSVIQRFQIEDLVVQDSSGVVFRAVDTDTGQTVSLRRFFPFGPTGGGLNADERAAYDVAVERLAGVSHPALRAVICGACDPVDGMPFIATEWIEGNRLQSFIDHAPLSPAEAANLLSLALDVCQLLSEMLEEEAIWVETSLEAIVVGSEESHRGFTFWISPLKWLGQNEGQHGLESIITLAEQVMGWEEQDVTDQAGMGLGAWLRWLRASAETASIHEAREMLAMSFSAAAPSPTKKSVLQAQANRPIFIRKKNKSSGIVFLIVGALVLIVIAGGGWALIQWRNANDPRPPLVSVKPPPTPALPEIPAPPVSRSSEKIIPAPQEPDEPTVPGESLEERAMRLAKEGIASPKIPAKPKPKPKNPTPPTATLPKGVFAVTDHDSLVAEAQKGNNVSVEGVFVNPYHDKTKKLFYLFFTKNAPPTEFRGIIHDNFAVDGLSESSLELLKGRTIKLQGKVVIEKSGTEKNPVIRPVILIENRAAIEVK